MVSKERYFPNVGKGEAMANVENGVTAIQAWRSLIGCETVAGGGAVHGEAGALPSGIAIDRMAVGVISAELEPVAQLPFHADLKAVITRAGGVLPDPQSAEIWIQPSERVDSQAVACGAGINLAAQTTSQVIGHAGPFRQAASGQPVLVIGPKQVSSKSPYIIDFQHQFVPQFTLNSRGPVFDEGIAQSLLKNDSGQARGLRIGGIPSGNISGCLRTDSRVLRRRSGTSKSGRAPVHGTIDEVGIGSTSQKIEFTVLGIVRRIKAGDGKPPLETAFVRDTKTAAQRSLAIAEPVPGKTEPRTKIIVVPFFESL